MKFWQSWNVNYGLQLKPFHRITPPGIVFTIWWKTVMGQRRKVWVCCRIKYSTCRCIFPWSQLKLLTKFFPYRTFRFYYKVTLCTIFWTIYFLKSSLSPSPETTFRIHLPCCLYPVRTWVRIGPPHPLVCRKRRLNAVVLRMRPEKPRPRVTAGVAR